MRDIKTWRFTPPQFLAFGFLIAIFIGSILLAMPMAWAPGKTLNYLDALFTATSAVCVTGLVVVDTGTHFSAFGKIIILLLIQLGGLGLMTSGTMVALALGRRIGLRERMLMQEALNRVNLSGLVRITRYIVYFTFGMEAIAALVLGIYWAQDMGWEKGMAFGLFHSVSAFNNAGFDIFGEFRSLTGYVDDIIVNFVIGTLFVVGGLGFGVISDVFTNKGRWRKLELHTKLVLLLTGALILVGAINFYILERNNPATLKGLSPLGVFLATVFQSITPRTAGFNTVDTGALLPSTLWWFIILMFIGASPGSTGGGIKTTTFGIVILAIWSIITGKDNVEVFERSISKDQVLKGVAIIVISLTLISVILMTLSFTENFAFERILFEVFSAFGTVGLSTGITPQLSPIGRGLIMVTMFVGRVGPLTLAYALAKKKKKTGVKYPEENAMVG